MCGNIQGYIIDKFFPSTENILKLVLYYEKLYYFDVTKLQSVNINRGNP